MPNKKLSILKSNPRMWKTPSSFAWSVSLIVKTTSPQTEYHDSRPQRLDVQVYAQQHKEL